MDRLVKTHQLLSWKNQFDFTRSLLARLRSELLLKEGRESRAYQQQFVEVIGDVRRTRTYDVFTKDLVPRNHRSALVRHLVELCDWSDVSDCGEEAAGIWTFVMHRLSWAAEPLCEEQKRTIRIFTPDVIQRIQDQCQSHNLLCALFAHGTRFTPTLMRVCLDCVPDTILFDVRRVATQSTARIGTPIIEMIDRLAYDIWCNWEATNETNVERTCVLESIRLFLEKLPTRGFLSRKVEVESGMHQYVLHAIVYRVIEVTAGRDIHHSEEAVLDVLQFFFRNPEFADDIRAVKNTTSYHPCRPPDQNGQRWTGLTLEDMVRHIDPNLLPTAAKSAFVK